MPVDQYEIGIDVPSLTNLESLTTPVNPPRSIYSPASIFIDRADGSTVGRGFPWTIWQFPSLDKAMLDQLRIFCPGYSEPVYIQTRIQDDTFAIFSGVMVWPSKEQMEKRIGAGKYVGFYQGLEFIFRRLVLETP